MQASCRNGTCGRVASRKLVRLASHGQALRGGREAARARLSTSEAVLRDCVKAVYEKLGCSSEAELMATLRTG